MRTKDEIFRTAYIKLRMKGQVEGPGDINRIKTRYKWQRSKGDSTTSALSWALVVVNHSPVHFEPSLGKPNEQGYRYVVVPAAYGLRFVDYHDVINDGRNSHEGWFTSHDGRTGEVYRGCVFRLPGRKGKSLLLAGYYDKEGGGYVVDFSEVYTSIPTDHPTECDNELWLVARQGDRMAERDAEESREHDWKWQQANRWQEAIDSLDADDAIEFDRLREKIKEIEGDFPDVEAFAREYI